MLPILPYKPAKIYKGKAWFVYYSYMDPLTGKFTRFIFKKNINRIKDLRDRYAEAMKIRDAINESLKSGELNPFNPKEPESELSSMPLITALEWAFEKRKPSWALQSVNGRRSVLNHLSAAIVASNKNLPLKDVKKIHVKLILEQAKKERDLSNTRFNAYLETFSTLMAELEEWELIEFNPAAKIKRLQKEAPTTHTPLTSDELLQVAEHLKKECYPLYVFTKIIFRAGVRPDEILELKYGQVHNGFIQLEPSTPTTKKKRRLVPIDADLQADIEKINVLPGEYYFSSKQTLSPGPTRLHRNRVSEMWLALIKEGLGIDKTMYSLKATGADARLKAGNKIEDVQFLFGHSATETTRIYDKHDRERLMAEDRLRLIIPEY